MKTDVATTLVAFASNSVAFASKSITFASLLVVLVVFGFYRPHQYDIVQSLSFNAMNLPGHSLAFVGFIVGK